MSYTKQNWADGDLITAAKLNHIEDGLADAGGIFIVEANAPLGIDIVATLNTTWQQVFDAMNVGKTVFARYVDEDMPEIILYPVTYVGFDEEYYIGVRTEDSVYERDFVYYISDTPDGALRRG